MRFLANGNWLIAGLNFGTALDDALRGSAWLALVGCLLAVINIGTALFTGHMADDRSGL